LSLKISESFSQDMIVKARNRKEKPILMMEDFMIE
jgi:hypothetical protein